MNEVQALRLALAQINCVVGDLASNSASIVEWTVRAAHHGANVVVFPKMALTGYPIGDLALRPSFVSAAAEALTALAVALDKAGCGDRIVVVGCLDGAEPGSRSSAAVLFDGQIEGRYREYSLPTRRACEETRHFAEGSWLTIVTVNEIRLGIVVGEEIWNPAGAVHAYAAAGVDVMLCLDASPFEQGGDAVRRSIVERRATETSVPVAYVNMVGGQDESVFDGASFVIGPAGSIWARAPQFVEQLLTFDVDAPRDSSPGAESVPGWTIERATLPDVTVLGWQRTEPICAEIACAEEQVWGALVTGLRDFVHKNGFRSVVLESSGDIDSAVVVAIAVDALGSDNVHAISMPSSSSPDRSVVDAQDLAERTGIDFRVEPIATMVASCVSQLQLTGVAEDKIDARCRGMLLMAVSDTFGHVVLATGNKSELAVGCSYENSAGEFAPIQDVPKSLVRELAQWRNASAAERGDIPPIPQSSIDEPSSAQLRTGQLDIDPLSDYDRLDAIVFRYLDKDQRFEDIVAAGFDAPVVAEVLARIDAAEYKRRQYPIGPRISSPAFGRDRRMPVGIGRRESTARDASGPV